jgi:Protein of unknown function (DUF1428)
MNYVDGFVAAVQLAKKEAYLKHAVDAAVVFSWIPGHPKRCATPLGKKSWLTRA